MLDVGMCHQPRRIASWFADIFIYIRQVYCYYCFISYRFETKVIVLTVTANILGGYNALVIPILTILEQG